MSKIKNIIENIKDKARGSKVTDLDKYPSGDFKDRIDELKEMVADPKVKNQIIRNATVIENYDQFLGLIQEINQVTDYQSRKMEDIDIISASIDAQNALVGNPLSPVFYVGNNDRGELVTTMLFKYNNGDCPEVCALVDNGQLSTVEGVGTISIELNEEDNFVEDLAFASNNEKHRMKVTADLIDKYAHMEVPTGGPEFTL